MPWTRVLPSAAASDKLLKLRRRADPPIESTFGSIRLDQSAKLAFELLSFGLHVRGNSSTATKHVPALWNSRIEYIFFLPLSAKAIVSEDLGRKNPDHRALISRAVEKLVSGWNKKDSEAIVGLFFPDAVLRMSTGKIARTRSAIRQRLLEEWNGKLQDTTLTHVVEAVSLQGSDAAVVKGRYRLNGVKILGFENAPEGSFIFRHKRQQGGWMILKAELLRDQAARK